MVVVRDDDDKVDQSGGSRGCDVVEMTTREMVMRVACGCHGDKGGGGEGGGGGCRGVRLGAAGSWPENGAGAENLKWGPIVYYGRLVYGTLLVFND
ncbi:hypothetical protein Tco_1028968 [Tanacetum coccineum]|uniref:Uncharacterized protein n=1 Tax=Tanacetum coccineum TaxID=301880 RepID=A0ABQ5G4A6_9ASTR